MTLKCLLRSSAIWRTKDCRLSYGVSDQHCILIIILLQCMLPLSLFCVTVAIEMIANKLFEKYIEQMEAKVRNSLYLSTVFDR